MDRHRAALSLYAARFSGSAGHSINQRASCKTFGHSSSSIATIRRAVSNALVATERFAPALLAKAFRGELVPQDPNDEPAAGLMKRLAQQRTGESKATKGTRTKRVAPVPLSDEEPTNVE
jgi:hypothetical protein